MTARSHESIWTKRSLSNLTRHCQNRRPVGRNPSQARADILLGYLTTLLVSKLYTVGWSLNGKLERYWEGSGRCLIETLSRNFPERTAENEGKLYRDNRRQGWISNKASPEHDSTALLLEQPVVFRWSIRIITSLNYRSTIWYTQSSNPEDLSYNILSRIRGLRD